jgi:osmotically-inducible protein OsmY
MLWVQESPVASRNDLSGSLSALALAVVALVVSPAPRGQAPAPAAPEDNRPEVIITAKREADAALAAKVDQAIKSNRYIFADHINVSAENGVVRVEGVVNDPADMIQLLRLARRAAGHRRVINEIEFADPGVDHD